MDFLVWHYSWGVNYFLKRIRNAILLVNHQVSLSLLLPTLFSPWKRLIIIEKRPGIHLAEDFEELTFNIVSRGIGAIVRLFLFLFGLIGILVVTISGLVGLFFWLVFPFLSLPLYSIYKRQPEFVMKNLLSEVKDQLSSKRLLGSDAGKFLLKHLGEEAQVKSIFPEELKVTNKNAKSFKELMSDIVNNNDFSDTKLREAKVKIDDLVLCAAWWDKRRIDNTTLNTDPKYESAGIGLSLTYGYTPTLDKYVSDMGGVRTFSHHLIAREDTVSRMVRVLTSGKGIMLTGVPGVGKKTTVYEFARRAEQGLLGDAMSYKRILDFDYNALIAGSSDLNLKKKIFEQILLEAESSGNVILVIRDIFRIINSEVEGIDFSDIISKTLENKRLFIISTLDKSDYDRFVSRNGRMSKYFEEVVVPEISKEEAIPVLLSAARYSEKTRNILTPIPVLREILLGSEKYLTDTPFPEKTLELLDAVLLYHEEHLSGQNVKIEEVQAVLSEKTGIALASMGDEQKVKLTNLEEIIHKRLVNQEYPISLIAKALRSKTAGVVNNNRPIGSFLFLGPTGVGKTETAKTLAELYFGSEKKILRFDMSEYSGGESIERLIGSVTKNTPGLLTDGIKNNPSCLLLLDEIEKSSPQVLNLFLALLDEGKITDAFGRSVTASHCFVIATSNAGSEYIRQSVKDNKSDKDLQEQVLDHILKERLFAPEFLNRFDGVVVYEPLSVTNLKEIAKRELSKLSNQMDEKGIKISFSENVYDKVVEEGYDPALGARPMRRMIELTLGDFLAKGLLSGDLKEGDSINVSSDGGKNGFVWEKM